MTKRIKNHHFVPKTLQRNFLADQNCLWYSERGQDGHFLPPERRNIEKAFRRRNYYTVLENNVPSDIVEREYYGKLDNYLGGIIPQILKMIANGKSPVFSAEGLNNFRHAIMAMTRRSPELSQLPDDYQVGKELLSGTLEKLSQPQEHTRQTRIIAALKDPLKVTQLGRDVRVRAHIRPSEKIDLALEEFSVRWAVCRPRNSFILSSLIAYRIGNGGSNGLSGSRMELWMPISPRVSVVLLKDPTGSIPLRAEEDHQHSRQVNEHAMRHSNQIASHSRALLEALIKRNPSI